MDTTVALVLALVGLVSCCNCILINIRPFHSAILQAHNFYRRLEPASNMRFMTWDRYLEARAAQWASNCYFEHQRGGLGENLSYFTSTGSPVPPRSVIQRSIGLWASEKPIYRWTRSCGAACHYTQLIWATTSRVGCALSFCPVMRVGFGQLQTNAMYFACFYAPAGNFIGQYPFIPGPRCSRCGRGQSCVRGLCGGYLFPFSRRRRRSVRMTSKDEFMGIVSERADGF